MMIDSSKTCHRKHAAMIHAEVLSDRFSLSLKVPDPVQVQAFSEGFDGREKVPNEVKSECLLVPLESSMSDSVPVFSTHTW